MLFDYFEESKDDFEMLIQYMEILITSRKETCNYLERYLS